MDKLIKILIADDEPEVLNLIEDCLLDEFKGAKTTKAKDGLEAYHYAMTMEYDLIISDHKMPFCTGLDFVTKIKSTTNTNSETPVIFVSGYIPEIEEGLSISEGILYIDKPFTNERLTKFCKMLLNKK